MRFFCRKILEATIFFIGFLLHNREQIEFFESNCDGDLETIESEKYYSCSSCYVVCSRVGVTFGSRLFVGIEIIINRCLS